MVRATPGKNDCANHAWFGTALEAPSWAICAAQSFKYD